MTPPLLFLEVKCSTTIHRSLSRLARNTRYGLFVQQNPVTLLRLISHLFDVFPVISKPPLLAPPGYFSWIVPGLKSPRNIKAWIRCCVALAASSVLMVVNKTLYNMGQAGFFAALVAVMVPPSIALSLFLLGIVTLLSGMMVGWAWGCAIMAAGQAARNPVRLAQQLQHAQASLKPGISPSVQFQVFSFHGMFLDPGTSAVYGALFFVGTFALGSLRAFIPKLTLFSIFGSIVLDIMCTYGPLLPHPQYTLSKMFILPTVYYVAIAIATLIFIFPESLNLVWLTTLQDEFFNPVAQILSHQSQALNSRPSDDENWARILQQSQSDRKKLVSGTQTLLGQINMIDLEISVGRLGPGDLQRISVELKSLMFRTTGLHAFLIFVNNTNLLHAELERTESEDDEKGKYHDRYTRLQREIRERELRHGHDFDSLMPILEASSAELRAACESAVTRTQEWLHDCNSRRWMGYIEKYDKTKGEQRHAALVAQLAALQGALQRYRDEDRLQLIQPFERFFDPVTKRRRKSDSDDSSTEVFAARSLYICFVFEYALDAFAERLVKFLQILVDLDGKRPKPRLWWPSGFRKLAQKLISRREVDQQVIPLASGTSDDPTSFDNRGEESDDEDEPAEVKEFLKEKPAWKNPDALPPKTAVGRFFLMLGNMATFFHSPEGIFGLRHGIVSVALWIPSVCPSSAWFYYENRGLWALIMAQLDLAVYAGDQIAGFVVRISGTGIGLVVGMAAWYVGAGHGNGNPYGVVIATTAFTAPFLFARLASPSQQTMLWVMAGITIVFVVGYSWINRHYPVLVNTGVGVSIAWKRALLVIIGFTAAFIVMMVPHPTSARTLVRHTLAATAGELKHILAVEVEALLAEEARARGGYQERAPSPMQQPWIKEQRVRRIAYKALIVITRLHGLTPSLQTARFEPQLSGKWPFWQYARLHATQLELLSSLMLFTGAFAQLDPKWCSVLVHQTPFLNPNLLSDVFANLALLSYALSGGHPLPPSLPRLRDRVVYHERIHPPRPPGDKKSVETESVDTEDTKAEADFVADKVDGSSLGFDELTLDVLTDAQLPAHATAVVALSNVLRMVDDMSAIVRDLCGEMSFEGLMEFQREWIAREEKALGGGFSHRIGLH
ncbi:putative ER transporter, 6TM, N-terminal [Lyophyllum shimeji]|uniref:ER transporter, 6TM, N-terminal n=1 Tax=Lyophyllum shimeji TaxID=47721 RepID=A0A9P3PJU1_LYOSH|nr:putative ER transporter, 6TM, N-terminal [Lyophyllum shimeji]